MYIHEHTVAPSQVYTCMHEIENFMNPKITYRINIRLSYITLPLNLVTVVYKLNAWFQEQTTTIPSSLDIY